MHTSSTPKLISLAAVWILVGSYFTASAYAEAPLPPSAETPTAQTPETIDEPADAHRIDITRIDSLISLPLLKKLQGTLNQTPSDPVPAGLIVLLNSNGGDGVVAMEMGRLLRKHNAHIFVTGKCASACTFVLAGGVVRGAPPLSVGIHRGRLTVNNEQSQVMKEINTRNNPKMSKYLAKFEQSAATYFEEMGTPPAFFTAMQSIDSKDVHWLTEDELELYTLNGFDQSYLAQRAKVFQQRSGMWHMDRTVLEERTRSVAKECLGFKDDSVSFARCYKNTLGGMTTLKD